MKNSWWLHGWPWNADIERMEFEMSILLERAEHVARDYQETEQSTWEQVKLEHDRVMVVFLVDDLVLEGCFALETWFKHVEKWHEWVSEDASRYDAKLHEGWNSVEKLAVKAVRGTLELIGKIKKWGFDVEKEQEFKELADRLFLLASVGEDASRSPDIDQMRNDALDDYREGRTATISNWGE